jgi:hypothetical protein
VPGGFLAPRRADDGGRDEFDESTPFNKPEWRLGSLHRRSLSTVNRSHEGPSINDLIRICGHERVPFLPFSASPFVGKRGYGLERQCTTHDGVCAARTAATGCCE